MTRSPDGKLRDGFVQIQMPDSQEPPIVSPEYLIGMRLNDLRQSLPAVCQTNKAIVLPSKIKDTSNAFHLKLSSIQHGKTPEGKSYTYDVTFDLDSAHSMLPCLIQVEFAPETKAFVETHRNWFQRWRVLEFARVPDESTKSERWFPRRGILEQGGNVEAPTFELTIENVRLNANLQENLFDPYAPDGAILFVNKPSD